MGRAIIAIRVSPRPAENVRYSPELQEEQCREWCRENDHEVVGIVSDILVSGGSRHRFDSILRSIEETRPDLAVFADLSRWTRDTPTRFWAVKAILDDAGVRLVSVNEAFVGSDMPFSDTITTAVVEGNYQQRLIQNRKTSEGVRRAWAKGKRFGRAFGWTWHPLERHSHEGTSSPHGECAIRGEWTYDAELIRGFYNDWITEVSLTELARRYGMGAQNVTRSIASKRQIDVVGPEIWHRANQMTRGRAVRNDAKWGNVWRGMLGCPCGRTLVADGTIWGRYLCPRTWDGRHGWRTLSARKYVLPTVTGVLGGLRPPPEAYQGGVKRVQVSRRQIDPSTEIARLSEAWAKGRLPTERYERRIAELETQVALPPPPPKPEVVADLQAIIPFLDCYRTCMHDPPERCPRNVEAGGHLNRLLRELLERIEVDADRGVSVRVREQYAVWASP